MGFGFGFGLGFGLGLANPNANPCCALRLRAVDREAVVEEQPRVALVAVREAHLLARLQRRGRAQHHHLLRVRVRVTIC